LHLFPPLLHCEIVVRLFSRLTNSVLRCSHGALSPCQRAPIRPDRAGRLQIRFHSYVWTLGALIATLPAISRSQAPDAAPNDNVRVTVSINEDGSRTIYEFDAANHKATATTRDGDGKLRGRIRYVLDPAGRFSSGEVFGPDEKLRFKTLYKYGDAGRLVEENQLGQDDSVRHKIVYTYDQLGKQVGYSVYDAKGKLLNKVGAPTRVASPTKKKTR